MINQRSTTLLCLSLAATTSVGLEPVRAQSTIVSADGKGNRSIGVGDIAFLAPRKQHGIAQLKLTERAGYRTPLHLHELTDESFYVLKGCLTFHSAGKTTALVTGDYVFIPRGTAHAQGNTTASETVVLTTLIPGDFASFFEARAELVKFMPPNHPEYGSRMRALGQKDDIKILGPAPF